MTVTLAAALALATGLVFLVGGLVKLGWIVNFMSKAVMAGFITGMAIQIIVGQLGHVTGVKESSGNTFQKLWSVLSHVSSWNWTSTAVGLLAIALIFTLQRYLKAVPAALTAVVLASVYVAIANPDIELVKKIPKGLSSFAVPTGLSGSTWVTLLLGACVVALVGFSEGWGAESAIAGTTHDELDSNQEFRAFGVGSIGPGLLGGMVVAGSLSKSSAAITAGAESIRGLKRYASRYDVEILIARLHTDARKTLTRDGVLAEIGEDHIYDSVHAAVAAGNGPAEQEDKGSGR
jgi:MFS superfamily sulfate permease-like transporter